MLLYINPFLSTESGHDSLYAEALLKNYVVRTPDGKPFMNRNTNFSAALIDLANPNAREWIKGVMKQEMIERGASGWMNDFGEALPFDAKLYGDADPASWHNRYAEEWARVAREAIDETGRGDDLVFFSRSGFTKSPGFATLFWLGDQIQNWNEFDGIKTAVVGLLSGGVSGQSLNHSDTGGYSAFKITLAGKEFPIIARSPELQMRWTELNAFTAVLRTHEGLVPSISAQFDSSDSLLKHTARFAKVFVALASYRKRHVAMAAARGYPLVRHPFLEFPDDSNTHGIRYQFLLGPDLLVAPVLTKGKDSVNVYFPGDNQWVDLWSGREIKAAGEWKAMPAPLGRPAVFIKSDAVDRAQIHRAFKESNLLDES